MKKKLRAIIVDDERLARNDLRSLLSEYKEIEVVAEADNVDKAIESIAKHDPDIIFLDIQMPGKSGFNLLEQIDVKARVIFVTAFDEYAIRAFEVDAIDYLLKPVNPERLKNTIERLEHEGLDRTESRKKLQYDDTIFLTINAHLKFMRINTIVFIQAAGDYSEITTNDGKKGLAQKSLTEWEHRLPEKYFCRIHRSTIVNLDYVNRIDEWFGNSFHVYMKNIETPLILSRRYAALLRHKMG